MKRIAIAFALMLTMVSMTACEGNKQALEQLQADNTRLTEENAALKAEIEAMKAAAPMVEEAAPMTDETAPMTDGTEAPAATEAPADAH